LAAAVAALLAMPSLVSGQEGANDEVFTQKRAVAIPNNALVSFDISWFDSSPGLNKYYLADRNNKSIDVIASGSSIANQFAPGFVGARSTCVDTSTTPPINTGILCSAASPCSGTLVCTANNDVSGPDGVLTVDHKELWVGDGDSRVWVLDPTDPSMKAPTAGAPNPIPTSPTGTNHKRADELCYDSADHLVMAANNADDPPFASIISTTTYTVVAKIPFDGTNGAPKSTNGAEQCQWSPRTGMFYISIPGVNDPDDGTGVVAVIDPKAKKVVKVFPIPLDDCAAPQGMAVGPDSQILLGCNQPSPNGHSNTVIINEHSGAVVGRLPDLGGNDEVWFNPGDGHYFLAEGQLVPTEQLGIVDSAGKRPDHIVKTADNPGATTRRAHSIAADPGANEVYVPIPANTTGFSSTLCSSLPNPANGCVAVFGTGPKDDHPRVVRERAPDDKQE
jgi:hypothetical protein